MSYQLGIDLGTTYTAAAVHRGQKVEIVSLGDRATAVPSVVYLASDGSILVGEAANRRAVSEPQRVARQFKRRMGDATPMLLGGTPYSAEALTAKLLRWTVEKVSELEGGPPEAIAVTHPANWGAFKLDRLGQAIRLADGRLWVAATFAATVARIDPTTGAVDPVPAPPDSDPLAVAVADDGAVWVSLRNAGQVIRLDPGPWRSPTPCRWRSSRWRSASGTACCGSCPRSPVRSSSWTPSPAKSSRRSRPRRPAGSPSPTRLRG